MPMPFSRRIAPSLATVAVVAFFAMVVLPRTTIPLVDGDVWWHLRAGEEVLQTGRVPRTDEWTIAGGGMEWISQDWLANTAMAAILRAHPEWGSTVLSLAFGAVVAAAFGLLWSAISRRNTGVAWIWKIVALTVGLIVAGPIVGVRVQTLDLLFASLTVWLLWRYLAAPGWLTVVALPAVAALWVNSHAGFPMLFLLGGAVVAGEAVDRFIGRTTDPPPLSWSKNLRLAAGLVAAVPAVALNPNGLAMYAYPFRTASIGAHQDFIFEWSRPDLTSFPGQVVFVFLLGVVVPTLWFARRRMRAADTLWLLGLAAMSLMAVRFAIFLGPIGAAVAAVNLRSEPAGPAIGKLVRRMATAPAVRSRALLNGAATLLVVVTGATIAVARSAPPVQEAAVAEGMPVAAVRWLQSARSAERLFNVYAWGGYIGRELPDALVYIDGRSDIYGDDVIREYALAITLQEDPAPLLERARVDTVVFWREGAFAEWLDARPEWSREYADTLAAVWTRSPTP